MTAAAGAGRSAELNEPETIYVMPQIPTEQEKIDALKLAYQLNGNSMVARNNRMIDLTDPATFTRVVTTVPVAPPLIEPPADGIWPKLEKPKAEKRMQKAEDVCVRHGMHKVTTGSSWRCRK
jgi:hypothetical protein